MYIVFLFFSTILLSGFLITQKLYQKSAGTSLRAGVYFNAIIGLLTAVIFYFVDGFKFEITAYSFFAATVFSLLCLLYTVLGFKIMKSGAVAVYTIFLMCGGMIVPYFYGIAFLNETVSLLKVFGLIIIIASVILTAGSINKMSTGNLIMCLAIFFLNGFVSVVSKLHQVETNYETVSALGFVILTGITKSILCLIILIFFKFRDVKVSAEKTESFKFTKIEFIIAVASCILGGFSYLLQLISAGHLPASVEYPIVTGGGIIFTAFAALLFFREKPSLKIWISVCLCLIGTSCFVFT